MALLNILIDQLGAGMTLGFISFIPVQYKLLLSGFWFTQHEIYRHFAFFPSICLCEFVVSEGVTLTTQGINSLVIQGGRSQQQHQPHRPVSVLSLDPPPRQGG